MKSKLAIPLPTSREQIRALQRERKARAVESARRSRFWRPRLSDVDTAKLDDPSEWRKIPILDKETLRSLSNDEFYNDFCIPAPGRTAEHWRSGGTTGRPLFYPRTFEDIRYAMVGFARSFIAMNVGPSETAHLSLPLGIHPAGQMWARAGEMMGIGINWVGSGAAAPSELQLELIDTLKPSLWIGMPSYGLHLANLASARGQDLQKSSVKKILCTAEPLSRSKREKLERAWGAKVYDAFGMTEVSMMGAEGVATDGLHIWTDLAFIEVVDPDTREPVPAGEPGLLVVTSLFTNNATPFLRWSSGDIVTCREDPPSGDPLSVFPLVRLAHRTAGFFKIRGININHAELEDLMFADSEVNDFQAEASTASDLEVLRLSIEIPATSDAHSVVDRIRSKIKKNFELTPEIIVLATGALAKEFEKSVKAPRFLDRRQ